MSWNTTPADQAADRTEATDSPSRSRRDLLKVVGSAGAASLGMVSLVDTAAASESGEEKLGTSGSDRGAAPTTGAPTETESVETAGNLRTGPKAITVAHPPSGTVAILHIDNLGWWYVYNNSWEYANYINDNTAVGNCETQYGIFVQIRNHLITGQSDAGINCNDE